MIIISLDYGFMEEIDGLTSVFVFACCLSGTIGTCDDSYAAPYGLQSPLDGTTELYDDLQNIKL